MFKRIITLLFIAAFALQTFGRVVIIANYYVDTESYAQNCENKNRPRLHCDGKCQLTKQLKAQDKKENNNPETKLDKEIVFCAQSYFPNILRTVFFEQQKEYPETKVSIESTFISSLFHPPNFLLT